MSARPGELQSRMRAPLDPAALVDALHSGDIGLEHSPLGSTPWLYLDLGASQATLGKYAERLVPWLRGRGCPVIGHGGSPATDLVSAACDVVVTDDAEAQALIDRIERSPLAAMTLVQVLRAVEQLPDPQALAVESLGYATLQAGPEFRDWLAARPRQVWPTMASAARSRDTPLRLERSGPVLTITLARPERRNAISTRMRDALVEAFELVAGDRAITSALVRGEGPDFCAGGDLAEFGTAPDPATSHAVRSARSPAAVLAACSDRVHFRVHGACVGAGIELAAFACNVAASRDAWFQLPELAFGLIPGAGGCVSMVRRIGRQRTALLALSGRRIDAGTALAWGLIDSISE